MPEHNIRVNVGAVIATDSMASSPPMNATCHVREMREKCAEGLIAILSTQPLTAESSSREICI